MSGGSSQQTQQLDPALRDAYLANVASAQGVAAGLAPREFAGYNADQNQAFALNRLYASPLSAPTMYATDAANILKQGSQYQPQNVQYGAYGGATVDPAALAAQQGYTATTGQYASAGPAATYGGAQAGPASLAQATGYTAQQFGGVSAGPAERAQAAALGRGDIRDVSAQQVAAERVAAQQAAAAQAARSGARDVSATGVTGAQVTSEALGQIAPQARQNVRDIQAASFLNQNIQQYMNPYTQAVTQQSLTDLERSRQLEQQRTAAQATAAKAFGGSRQGVAEAETNRAYGENAARLVAQQNAAAYSAAQQASEADLARTMQAQQLNQAQDAASTQQALQLAGQFGLANQDANLRAALANQGVDVQYGLSNAQMQQQAMLANQDANLRASLANQSTGLQAQQANQDASLRASLANQGVDLNVGQLNTQNMQQANLANQAAANQMAQYNASNLQQAGLSSQAAANQAMQFGAGAQNQASMQNAAAQNALAQFNAGNLQQAGLSNVAAQNQMGQFNAGNQQAMALANMGAQNQASQFGASAFNQAGLANQAAINARAAQQAGLTQQTGLTNAQNFLQANLANQQAGLTANQQRLTGGGQLASAATNLQNLGFGQANQLAQQGAFQQGFSQQQLDAIRNLPLEQQQIINQALGLNVGGGSGMQSSSTSKQGLLGLLGL